MSWHNGGSGPWGPSRPGGNRGEPPWGGGLPPEFAAWLLRLQRGLAGLAPGGGGPTRLVLALIAAIAVLWLASGFFRVQPDQQGVVLRFGAFVRLAPPGLGYHLPWPIESVLRPAVTRINRVEIGYRSDTPAETEGRDVTEESLMLTGDENIIDIDFTVFWRIANAPDYLFNIRHPAGTVKSVAESVMREVIGRTPIQPALTGARGAIEEAVRQGAQAILDRYHAGIEVTQVQLQKVDPPPAVIDSFRDVQRANTDAERMRNEAEAYRNDIIPRARGEAARITAEADGARQAAIAEAAGAGQRFDSVLSAYRAAKDITLERLYIETMEQVALKSHVTVIDPAVKGLLPVLPLGTSDAAPAPASPTTVGKAGAP
jgi:membrane protease subunit HflK